MNIKSVVPYIAFIPGLFTSFVTLASAQQQTYNNEMGFNQEEAYVKDLKAYWSYSSLYYDRLTKYGQFGGRINYANRFNSSAVQYNIETYPKFNKNFYGEFSFGFSKRSQIHYPTFHYRIEPYFLFSNNVEVSLGKVEKRYKQFHRQQISSYTGSLGAYSGNYYLWFRPSHFTKVSKNFYEINLRRYFKDDKDTYVTIKANYGKLPDIADVPPLDRIIVMKQKGATVDGQFGLTETLYLNGFISYLDQDYFSLNLQRDIFTSSIGLLWKF